MLPIDLELPKRLRGSLKEPIGLFFKLEENEPPPEIRVIEKINKNPNYTFIVGDVASKSIINKGYKPNIIIIDLKTQRESKIDFNLDSNFLIYKTNNKQGFIQKEAWELVKNLCSVYKNPEKNRNIELNEKIKAILVNGEEDLLVLPLILEAPMSSYILYGQPPFNQDGSQGIVLIEVNELIKEKIMSLMVNFERTKL